MTFEPAIRGRYLSIIVFVHKQIQSFFLTFSRKDQSCFRSFGMQNGKCLGSMSSSDDFSFLYGVV